MYSQSRIRTKCQMLDWGSKSIILTKMTISRGQFCAILTLKTSLSARVAKVKKNKTLVITVKQEHSNYNLIRPTYNLTPDPLISS